jgi:hypothetical protein
LSYPSTSLKFVTWGKRLGTTDFSKSSRFRKEENQAFLSAPKNQLNIKMTSPTSQQASDFALIQMRIE